MKLTLIAKNGTMTIEPIQENDIETIVEIFNSDKEFIYLKNTDGKRYIVNKSNVEFIHIE